MLRGKVKRRVCNCGWPRTTDGEHGENCPEQKGLPGYPTEVEYWRKDRAWLLARVDELAEALRGLHDDNVDYLRLNHLGGYDNHWLKVARAALARLESGDDGMGTQKGVEECKHLHTSPGAGYNRWCDDCGGMLPESVPQTHEAAVHDAITRALAEAGIRSEVLIGMCIEVGLEAYRGALAKPSQSDAVDVPKKGVEE
jgi:hypothetical protein